ncbi:MAG: CAP domain-containing protein [Lachnospiraceae bacterium]|nr:CAP domain-containing protein [Lachnospiraceae bacterium]
MLKSKESRQVLVVAIVILASAFVIIHWALTPVKDASITEKSVMRNYDDTTDTVYIEPEMVSLANALSGNAESKAIAKHTFDIVNAKRTEAGLKALTWDSGLEQASAVRAVEASQSFSHTRPDGSDWWTVNSNLMYGENLAKGYDTSQSVFDAWMASPTHKDNILFNEFNTGAIAIHIGTDGRWYWAQEFGY